MDGVEQLSLDLMKKRIKQIISCSTCQFDNRKCCMTCHLFGMKEFTT